jgi:hypothetical protein
VPSDRPRCHCAQHPDRLEKPVPAPGRNQPCPVAQAARPSTAVASTADPPTNSSPALTSQRSPAKRCPTLPSSPTQRLTPSGKTSSSSQPPTSRCWSRSPRSSTPTSNACAKPSSKTTNPDWGWDALTTVATQIDTPQQRAKLADALVNLRDQHQISRRQAAYALLDLHSPSTRLIGASLLEAVAVSVGVSRTPGGLQIAA